MAIGNPLKLAPMFFWHTCLHNFLNTSLFSGTSRYFRLTLYFSCPSRGINHFPKKPWFLILENGIWWQNLEAKCAHWFWGIIFSFLKKKICYFKKVNHQVYSYFLFVTLLSCFTLRPLLSWNLAVLEGKRGFFFSPSVDTWESRHGNGVCFFPLTLTNNCFALPVWKFHLL